MANDLTHDAEAQSAGSDAQYLEKTERPRISREAPEHVHVWANDAQIGHTPWDFHLILGRIMEASADQMVVDQTVTLHFSPQFMKRLIDVMTKNVENYEKRFGPIPSPFGLDDVQEESLALDTD